MAKYCSIVQKNNLTVIISADGEAVNKIELIKSKTHKLNNLIQSKNTILAAKQIEEYFKKSRTSFDFPIKTTPSTFFQSKVWSVCMSIPYGETRTYKWLADAIKTSNSARAVGNALGKNPLPIVIPCHRVIRRDGSLGGFSCGLDIKQFLLDLEHNK